MSTHPNALLLLTLSPEDLPRKTYKALVKEYNKYEDEEGAELDLGGDRYFFTLIDEDEYDEHAQIQGSAGDIVLWNLVTYGYGEQIAWEDLAAKVEKLLKWAEVAAAKHKCSYKISVSANYW